VEVILVEPVALGRQGDAETAAGGGGHRAQETPLGA
jgi:hypothetical protein